MTVNRSQPGFHAPSGSQALHGGDPSVAARGRRRPPADDRATRGLRRDRRVPVLRTPARLRHRRPAIPSTAARTRGCSEPLRACGHGSAIRPAVGGTGPRTRGDPSTCVRAGLDHPERSSRWSGWPASRSSSGCCSARTTVGGGDPARGARRDRLGRRLHRPPLRPGQRDRQDPRSGRRPGHAASPACVALLIDGDVPHLGRDRSVLAREARDQRGHAGAGRGGRPPHRCAMGRKSGHAGADVRAARVPRSASITAGAAHDIIEVITWLFTIGGLVLSYYAAARYIPMARRALREGRAQPHGATAPMPTWRERR